MSAGLRCGLTPGNKIQIRNIAAAAMRYASGIVVCRRRPRPDAASSGPAPFGPAAVRNA